MPPSRHPRLIPVARHAALAALCLSLLSCGCDRQARAEDAPVQARRAAILARALAYDNGMAARAGQRVVLAIVYRKGDASSEAKADETAKAFRPLEGIKIVGLPFHVIQAAYAGPSGLETLIDRDGADAFLLCDGLSAEIPAVRQLGRRRKVITVGGSESEVRAGLSLAVVNDDSRLQVVLNVDESRKQGVEFGLDLLRVARVVRP
jgi:hypothetical protein